MNLPDPGRTVRKSVGVCQRMGYTEQQALGLVMVVCTSVAAQAPAGGEFDLSWVAQVHEVARCRLRRLPPG